MGRAKQPANTSRNTAPKQPQKPTAMRSEQNNMIEELSMRALSEHLESVYNFTIIAIEPFLNYKAVYSSKELFIMTGETLEELTLIPFSSYTATSEEYIFNKGNKQYFFSSDGLCVMHQQGELNQIRIDVISSDKTKQLEDMLDTERCKCSEWIEYYKRLADENKKLREALEEES